MHVIFLKDGWGPWSEQKTGWNKSKMNNKASATNKNSLSVSFIYDCLELNTYRIPTNANITPITTTTDAPTIAPTVTAKLPDKEEEYGIAVSGRNDFFKQSKYFRQQCVL